jgi:hypothetical protein
MRMLRSNHYDVAFEAYLRACRTAYVAVDERRRSVLERTSLKSLDFLVYTPDQGTWLVDVKGRQFAAGGPGRRWENWATHEDLSGMAAWQELFGGQSRGLLVFAYDLGENAVEVLPELGVPFVHRGRQYAFFGVWADSYRDWMRVRSPRWETVWLPSPLYRELRFPLSRHLVPSVTVS